VAHSQWMSDLLSSASLFERLVKPALAKGDHHIYSVEAHTDSGLCKALDQMAGIDAWMSNRKGMRGIASRIQTVQDGREPFRSFTIRRARESGAATEYEKRKFAIENNYVYPYFTLQAYVDESETRLLALGICKTHELLCYVSEYPHECDTKRTGPQQQGQAEFIAAYWRRMKNHYWVFELELSPEAQGDLFGGAA
jgi:hypothetical protein